MSKKISRRNFLNMTVGAGLAAGISTALPWAGRVKRAFAYVQSPTNIRKFVVTLPGLGPSGKNNIGQYIPLARKQTIRYAGKKTDHYNLAVGGFCEKMHPDLRGYTDFFGYFDELTNQKQYLGGVIVAKRGTSVLLSVRNILPKKHILPVDPTLMAGPMGLTVGDLPTNRIVTHLHGGFTPWISDGTPFQWYGPYGKYGPSFVRVPNFCNSPGTGTYYYPNDQSARTVWYHDHAIGLTRLNAYAGIASAYIITDDFEAGLVNSGLLPDLVGIPLIIQDKGFVPNNIRIQDPTWKWGDPGDLWYPHEYEVNVFQGGTVNPKGRWDWGPTVDPPSQGTMPLPPVSAVPEASFDTILVNGGIYPKVSVPPKRVRFRMLNAAQARFFHLNLYPEDPFNRGEAKVGIPGPVMYQVGTEGGFLPQVAVLNNTTPIPLDPEDPSGNTAIPSGPFNLLISPAERADVIIDFNGVPSGSSFILYNDAPAPFPAGDPRNDYFTGNEDQTQFGGAPSTLPGYGPNTRTLLKIVVTSGSGDSISTSKWLNDMNTKLRTNFLTGNQPGLLFNNGDPSVPGNLPYTGPVHRDLTLNEDFDEFGRLIQTIGTVSSRSLNNQGLPSWGLPYISPATETIQEGAVEVWRIYNLTMDVHPIHLHLVNFQLIQRQPFTGNPDTGFSFTGDPTPPDANEMGWKDTLRMNPGEATTIIMKFDLPKVPFKIPDSPVTGGHEYVWHCHILEHEEHDMMRPMVVFK